MTFGGASQATLAPNAISKIVGTLNVGDNATPGPVSFSFGVNAATAGGTTTTTTTGSLVSYASTIQPFFNQSCVSCHGSSGGTTLSSYASTMASRYNSNPIVVAGNASGSVLYQSVNGGNMSGYGVTSAQLQSLANWINQGALNN